MFWKKSPRRSIASVRRDLEAEMNEAVAKFRALYGAECISNDEAASVCALVLKQFDNAVSGCHPSREQEMLESDVFKSNYIEILKAGIVGLKAFLLARLFRVELTSQAVHLGIDLPSVWHLVDGLSQQGGVSVAKGEDSKTVRRAMLIALRTAAGLPTE